MYGKPSKTELIIRENKRILIPVFILVAAIFILGLFPDLVLQLINPVLSQLPLVAP
jgi:NADH:ubiquinone oxidoreductase subunit 4 (subunit M)